MRGVSRASKKLIPLQMSSVLKSRTTTVIEKADEHGNVVMRTTTVVEVVRDNRLNEREKSVAV